MTSPILELLNVESSYGPVQALRGVSLAVPEGQIIAVLGANGAGKTTTLKTISGIIEPRKGGSDDQAHCSRRSGGLDHREQRLPWSCSDCPNLFSNHGSRCC